MITKFDLPKVQRVSPTAKRAEASTELALKDEFELDAERRQRQLDDWQDPQPDDSGFRFLVNPNEADNDLYDTLHPEGRDFTDTYVGSTTAKQIYEVLCPNHFVIVPRNTECACGEYHS